LVRAAADINRDGMTDIVAGPFYYLGPDYQVARENLSRPDLDGGDAIHTGDGELRVRLHRGWLAGRSSREWAADIALRQPEGELCRWDKYNVLPSINSQVTVFKDIDGDGKPDAVFVGGGAVFWAGASPGGAEMGLYDVNGDGLNNVVSSLEARGWGLAWYEQKRDKSGAITLTEHVMADDYSSKIPGNAAFFRSPCLDLHRCRRRRHAGFRRRETGLCAS
jgi:hypothetical protein